MNTLYLLWPAEIARSKRPLYAEAVLEDLRMVESITFGASEELCKKFAPHINKVVAG